MRKDKYLRVNELLKEKGKSQKELAKFLGMLESSFSTSLKNETFNVDKLAKIARYLDVQPSDLFVKDNAITCPNCGAVYEMKKK